MDWSVGRRLQCHGDSENLLYAVHLRPTRAPLLSVSKQSPCGRLAEHQRPVRSFMDRVRSTRLEGFAIEEAGPVALRGSAPGSHDARISCVQADAAEEIRKVREKGDR